MICGHHRQALCTTGILFLSLGTASAQEQGDTRIPATRIVAVAPDARLVQSARQIVTVTTQRRLVDEARQLITSASTASVQIADQAKPPSGRPPVRAPAKPSQRTSPSRTIHQGFSVVLVLADLKASASQDDVPPAAQRALADMKDFLPYKSYKLLDAAWVLGQGHQTIRLRGPEGNDYELRLFTQGQGASADRVPVQFSLREVQDEVAVAVAETARVTEGVARRTQLEVELAQAREKKDTARVRELEKELAAVRARPTTTYRRTPSPNRAIIDTSFTMEVGETVVVGTSRLKGNSSALIALLTAVPPRSSAPRETR